MTFRYANTCRFGMKKREILDFSWHSSSDWNSNIISWPKRALLSLTGNVSEQTFTASLVELSLSPFKFSNTLCFLQLLPFFTHADISPRCPSESVSLEALMCLGMVWEGGGVWLRVRQHWGCSVVWNSAATVSNSVDVRAVTPADLHLCLCAPCVVTFSGKWLRLVAWWSSGKQRTEIMAGLVYWMNVWASVIVCLKVASSCLWGGCEYFLLCVCKENPHWSEKPKMWQLDYSLSFLSVQSEEQPGLHSTLCFG